MTLFQAALLLAAFLCSLVAGFLFAFAAVVMPGIRSLDDGGFTERFRSSMALSFCRLPGSSSGIKASFGPGAIMALLTAGWSVHGRIFLLALSKSPSLVRHWIGCGRFALASLEQDGHARYSTVPLTRGGTYVSRVPHDGGADGRWRHVDGRSSRARRGEASCEERSEAHPHTIKHTGEIMMTTNKMEPPNVVSRDEWLVARKALLTQEKTLTRLRDDLSRQRRELPWERVEKPYVFDGPRGQETLADLFDGRSQLIVYHFMFGPEWKEGCPSCSFLADHIDGSLVHLNARDVTLLAVSRAPLAQIDAFKKRMGWRFHWVSSFGNDFNRDYHVWFTKDEMATGKVYYNYDRHEFPSEEAPGASVFYKDATGSIFHTYSIYARGADILIGAYNYLDLVPKGRDEDALAFTMSWVRHHDRYGDGYLADPAKPYWPTQAGSDVHASDSSCCSGEGHS
jgi:predicted dithiol-disulfide oxidoreductase (DUF899 family)